MDQALIDILGRTESPIILVYQKDWSVVDEATGEITIQGRDGKANYKLKPMDQLFGTGRGQQGLNPRDAYDEAILMPIELAIIHFENENDGAHLKDADVLLTLNPMCMNPAADCGSNSLMRRIQLEMRLCLSVNNFAKNDAKLAVRRIRSSVESHNRERGVRGYLDFIQSMLGKL